MRDVNLTTTPDMTSAMKQKTRRLAMKISLLLFVTFFVLFTYLSYSAKINGVESKIKTDKSFIINALKIGDYFFITKYVAAMTESGLTSSTSLVELNPFKVIVESPRRATEETIGPVAIGLKTTSFLRHIKLKNTDGLETWALSYRVDVGHSVILISIFLSLGLSLIILYFLQATLHKTALYFSQPILNLVSDINVNFQKKIKQIEYEKYSASHSFKETDDLANEINNLLDRISTQQDEIKKAEILKTLNELSRQVAHDIRSPIGAIKAALQNISNNPEKSIKLASSAVQRIEEVVGDLSIQNQEDSLNRFQGPLVEIVQHMEEVVNEKKIDLESIHLALIKPPGPIYLPVNPGELKRAISNIINNAYEAYGANETTVSAREVVVELSQASDINEVSISIRDKGAGMPQEIKTLAEKGGYTYGKKNGQGRGLGHANEMMQSLGGKLVVDSELGVGTQVTLVFKN
jgi:signal transduction histidine kinase